MGSVIAGVRYEAVPGAIRLIVASGCPMIRGKS
jgi:hypothetical protein